MNTRTRQIYNRILQIQIQLVVVVYLFTTSRIDNVQAALPEPPKVGSQSFTASDPIGYLIGSIKWIIFVGLTMAVVFAILAFSSGLISEINEARKKGEWGRFSTYFGAGIFVILVVIFGAWWGSTKLTEMIT